jgi:DNA-binding Lrp family transcriptional regulator
MPSILSALDLRIIGALMIDGRASWRRIATVLDEPERTVARRGTQLLSSEMVSVHGMQDPHRSGRGEPFLVFGSAQPGRAWNVAAQLARRPEALTSSTLLGGADFVADVWVPERRRAELFQHELPDIPGIEELTAAPILSYPRTLHDWDPGLLTSEERARVGAPAIGRWPQFTDERLSAQDQQIARLLVEDGRRPFEEIARLCGISEQTVARRVQGMRSSGALQLRAVFDPAVIGLPIGAVLWLRVRPGHLQQAADVLAGLPFLRYAAVTVGHYQLVADLRVPSKDHLYELMVDAPWAEHTDVMEASMVLEMLKQSDVLAPSLR